MLWAGATELLANPGIVISGNTNVLTLTHHITTDRSITFPDVTGTVLLSTSYQRHVLFSTGNVNIPTTAPINLIQSATNCTAYLPPGVNDLTFTIRNVGTGQVVVVPNGIDTIENVTFFILLPTNAIDVVYYSGNWYIF
jgi:hypothetical protein